LEKGHVAAWKVSRTNIITCSEYLQGRDPLEDLGGDARILNYIINI
jgi:hypothetical protein